MSQEFGQSVNPNIAHAGKDILRLADKLPSPLQRFSFLAATNPDREFDWEKTGTYFETAAGVVDFWGRNPDGTYRPADRIAEVIGTGLTRYTLTSEDPKQGRFTIAEIVLSRTGPVSMKSLGTEREMTGATKFRLLAEVAAVVTRPEIVETQPKFSITPDTPYWQRRLFQAEAPR